MTTEPIDLYAVLGLTPRATHEQIRRAYQRLVRQNHPDTRPLSGPGDDAASDSALQQALAAYRVLGDPGRRAGYDRRTPRPTRPSASVRVVRRTARAPDDLPIRAGPVRWQPHW